MSVLQRHNVTRSGAGNGRTLIFAHGHGCDQNVWQAVAGALAADHEVVLYDCAGCGGADPSVYDPVRHATLEGHADDLIAVCEAAQLDRPVLVAHSVGTMIGVLAAQRRPDLFDSLVLIAPSPSYLNDGAYVGGFEREDIDSLLDTLESNHFGWALLSALSLALIGHALGAVAQLPISRGQNINARLVAIRPCPELTTSSGPKAACLGRASSFARSRSALTAFHT